MRKRKLICALALLTTVLALPAAAPSAMSASVPATLLVDDDGVQCPGAGFTSIQAAVDAAAPGDTVDVCAGSYGGATVTKPVKLRGPRAGSSPAASCASAIVGATTDAIVSGATITLAAAGAELHGFVIENAATGVVTDSAGSGYVVANNLFQRSTDGLRLASSGATTSVASGNCFRHHVRAAIWSIAVPVKNVDIEDNAFVDNGNNGGDGWAMALGEFRFGDGLVWVEDVTIARNTSAGDNRFLEIPGSRGVVVDANRSDGTSTSVFLANNNVGTRVTGNTFADGQTGIYVSSIGPFGGLPNSGLEITGNVVTGMSGLGIATESGPSMLTSTVSGNTSSGNDYGISIAAGSAGNTISGNTSTGNATFDCRDDTTGSGTSGTANTWSGNSRGTENRPGLCPNRAPSASFAVTPGSGTTETSFAFDGTAASDPDGDTLTYTWDFGDGATASGVTTAHSYAARGTYTVTLTVGDGHGGSASTTRSVTVTAANATPTASFTVTPASGTTETSFAFDGTASSDLDGDALTYAWNFGDGATANGATTTHSYAAAGTYTATLTVTDGRGGSRSTSRSVTVSTPPAAGAPAPAPENRAPTASFAFTPAAPAAGEAVRFDGSGSADADGDTLTFAWSFGDGTAGGGAVVSRAFATPGTYTVVLTVTDGRGGSASASRTVTVGPVGRHLLTVRKVGRGEGLVATVPGALHCGDSCSASYAQGTEVVLRAVPATGFSFRGWSGGCSGLGSSCTVMMRGATTVTARFEPRRATDPVTLVVDARDGGAVATWEWGVDGAPVDCGRVCANQFRRDSFVRLVGVPRRGFDFAGWTGACAGQGAWCTLRLSSHRVTSPRFVPRPVTLSVTKSAGGTLATWDWGLDGRPLDCGGVCTKRFQEGARVRLAAVAAHGFVFAGWTGACAGQGSWCVLVLDAAATTHADFVARSDTSE